MKTIKERKFEEIEGTLVLMDGNNFRKGMSWNEQARLAGKLGLRLLSIQESHDLCAKKGEFFEKVMKSFWIWNSEQITQKDYEKSGAKSVADYLVKKKLLKAELKLWKCKPWFEMGRASVGSTWFSVGRRFYADALWPSCGDDDGLAVFKLSGKHKHRYECSCGKVSR